MNDTNDTRHAAVVVHVIDIAPETGCLGAPRVPPLVGALVELPSMVALVSFTGGMVMLLLPMGYMVMVPLAPPGNMVMLLLLPTGGIDMVEVPFMLPVGGIVVPAAGDGVPLELL